MNMTVWRRIIAGGIIVVVAMASSCMKPMEPEPNTKTTLSPPHTSTKEEELVKAAADGNISIVQNILDTGTDINARVNEDAKSRKLKGSTFGYVGTVVDQRTDKGYDIGATALVMASQNGHDDIVTMLLDRGADMEVKTAFGSTALYIAAQEGHRNIVKLLLAKGADVNVKTEFVWPPLFVASFKGYNDIVMELINAGANVNEKSIMEQLVGGSIEYVEVSALYIASLKGNSSTVTTLLSNGADVNLRTSKGWTALDASIWAENDEVVQILKKAGGKESAEPRLPGGPWVLSKEHTLKEQSFVITRTQPD